MRIFNNRTDSTNGHKNGYRQPTWYSAFDLIRHGRSGSDWPRAWRKHDLRASYDVVVIGGGVHGLATAYYLASEHGITDVAVLEKGYIGSGGSGRNTAIIRSNYLTPEGVRFYDRSLKLYETLSADLNFNVMFAQRGHLTLAHTDGALRTMRWRAEVNKLEDVDSEVIGPDEIKRLVPHMDTSENARYPILGALYHPPGGIIRHDAVVWGYARAADAFPYMRVRTGRIAGVDGCFMWRIGFTGELSYEIHVPAAYGLHVWETLLDRGADLGIEPFGVEAQRSLRLEKGHLIVGQDTDGLTGAYGAGLSWAVKLDKEDFAGKPELVWQSERDGYFRLVGLQPLDGSVVPPEGSQIVEGKNGIAGRITSSRMSPSLDRSICLGFVAPHLAEQGTTVRVQLPDGKRIPARVMEHHAHFDPEGVRQRV